MKLRSLLIVPCLYAACTVGDVDGPGPGGSGGGSGGGGEGSGADAGSGGEGGGGADAAPDPATERSVLEEFGSCMSRADFDAENLVALASIPAGEQVCADCHSGGTGGNYLTLDPDLMFAMITTYPYVKKYALVDADLNPIVSDAIPNKQNAGGAHPLFTLPPELAQSILDYFELTNARYQLGDCLPPL